VRVYVNGFNPWVHWRKKGLYLKKQIYVALVAAVCVLWTSPSRSEEPAEKFPDPLGPSELGSRGFLHTRASETFSEGSLILGATLEYFEASSFLVEGDNHRRMNSRFFFSAVPLRGLELCTGFAVGVNRNTKFDPQNTQSVGDPYLGVRYSFALHPLISVGVGMLSVFPSGTTAFQVSADGISTQFYTGLDLKPLPNLIVAISLGYKFDNSRFIFNHVLNESQMFSAGVNPHDQVLFNVGTAWKIGFAAPFVEYGLMAAMGAKELLFSDNPSRLTIGSRFWPIQNQSLHLMAALDIGLAGVRPPPGSGRIPPYNVVLGVAYDLGKIPKGETKIEVREIIQEKRVEVPVQVEVPTKPLPKLSGQVIDATTKNPIGGARISLTEQKGVLFVTDPKEGRFETTPMEPGPHKFVIERDGYAQQTQVVLLPPEGDATATIEMQPSTSPTFGTLKGTVLGVGAGPLPALISIPTQNIKIWASAEDGKFELTLPTGTYDILVSLSGYVTQRRKIKLSTGDMVILNVELYPKK
jgi:hypothetical protein